MWREYLRKNFDETLYGNDFSANHRQNEMHDFEQIFNVRLFFRGLFSNKILHIHAIFVRKLKHHQLNRAVEYIKSFWMIFFSRLFHFRFEWNKNPKHVYTSTYRMSVRPLAWCDWYVLAFIEYIGIGEMERPTRKIFNMIMSNNLLSINKWCVVQSNSCW